MNNTDKVYLDTVKEILHSGVRKVDRTGTGTIAKVGVQMRFDVGKQFPILTTKRVFFKGVVGELLWFISGSTNKKTLKEKYGTSIWDEWNAKYTFNRECVFVNRIPPVATTNNLERISKIRPDILEIHPYAKSLHMIWESMHERCYNENNINYQNYGADGTTIHDRWFDVNNFIEDVTKIPHWDFKKSKWSDFSLDKDYYSSNQYGPNTCVWLHSSENSFYKANSRSILVTFPDGTTKLYPSSGLLKDELGIPDSTLRDRLHKRYSSKSTFTDYEFVYMPLSSDGAYRYDLIDSNELGPIYGHQWRNYASTGLDQLKEAVNMLKTDPFSRRIIVTAWVPSQLNEMALPPCHHTFQFVCEPTDDKIRLNLVLTMRSNDIFLGNPFNMSSYALLLLMVCKDVDMVPGELVMNLSDAHIYTNHVSYITEQLNREPIECEPEIWLNPDKDLFSYEMEDIKLNNYKAHANWKNVPVAI